MSVSSAERGSMFILVDLMSSVMDLIIDVLKDGKWHTSEDILKRTGMHKAKLYNRISKLGNWYIIDKRFVPSKYIKIEYRIMKRRIGG